MTKRIKILSGIVFFLLYIKIIIIPINSKITTYSSSADSAEVELEELKIVIQKDKALNAGLEEFIKRNKFFPVTISFIGFVENELSKLGLRNKIDKINQKDNIVSENHAINVVELKFNDLNITQFLDIIENFNSTGYFIKVMSYELKKNSSGKFSSIIELQALSTKR